ncbi:tape measure protein [Paucilactobacillus sp. N302-9]
MARKLQAQMSTEIALDLLKTTNSIKSLTTLVNSATSAWKAQEAQLKSAGDYLGAAKTKYEGLGDAIKEQVAKISALKNEQSKLKGSTQKTAEEYLKYSKDINSAETRLASMQAQQTRAKDAMALQASGVVKLSSEIKLLNKANAAYVSRLEAEGKTADANKAKLAGLETTHEKLGKQLSKEESLLNQVKDSQGKSSEAYTKQKIRVDETATAMAKAGKEASDLRVQISKEAPTSWTQKLKNNLLGLNTQTKKTSKSFTMMKGAMASAIGNTVSNGISRIGSGLWSAAKNGVELAEAGEQTTRVWKSLGASGKGAKQLSDQMVDLRNKTGFTADDLKKMQKSFYGLTDSVPETKKLTQAMAGIGVASGLSGEKVAGMTRMVNRLASSSTVSTSLLGRLESRAPKMGDALAKAAGVSRKSFDDMVASGKITGKQFEGLMEKVSKQSPDAFKKFGETGTGAAAQISGSWKSMQSTVMKPLVKSNKTGLQEINKQLKDKDTQKGLTALGKGIANVATSAIKLIGFMGKHTNEVKAFGAVLLGAFASTKLISGIQKTSSLINGMIFKPKVDPETGKKGLTIFAKAVKGTGKGIAKGLKFTAHVAADAARSALQGLSKMAGIAGKAFVSLGKFMMANPFVAIAAAIVAIGVALYELYKHNKKFRNFVNGLAKAAKEQIGKIVKFFKNLGKTIGKVFGNIGKFLGGLGSSFKKGWKNISTATSNGASDVKKAWDKHNKAVDKANKKAWKNTKKTFDNGWNSTKNATNSGIKKIQKVWKNLGDTTGKIAKKMMKDHPKTFKAGYKLMQSESNAWKDVTHGHWNKLGNDTKKIASNTTKFWKNIFKDTYDWLNKETGGRLGDMLDSITTILGKISKVWKNMWQSVKDFFGNIWNGIKDLASDGIKGVVGFINKGINGIDGVIHLFGGKAKAISPIKLATGTQNGRLTKDTLAVLNDGNDSPETGNREMVEKKDGKRYLVNGRNTIAYLEKGDAVYNAKQTREIMAKQLPHFGLGSFLKDVGSTVGDFVSDKVGDVSSWIGDKFEAIEKFFKDPVGQVTKVFDKAVGNISKASQFVGAFTKPAGHYIIKQGKDWFKKLFESLNDANSPAGKMSKSKFAEIAQQAASLMNQSLSASDIAHLYFQAVTESGADPAQNGGYDDHDGSGLPVGLFQYKRDTWNAWAVRNHKNIHSALDQIMAVLNDSSWRSDFPPIGVKRGWGPTGHRRMANGGLITNHQMIEVGEGNRPEMVIPLDTMKRSRANQLLDQVHHKFSSETGTTSDNSFKQLSDKFDTLIGLVGQMLGLNQAQLQAIKDQGTFDTKSLYKRQAKDLSISQYGGLT